VVCTHPSLKIPIDLETICLKALEKDVDRRYATAGEMAQDLRQYLHGGLIAARRAGIHRRTWKSIRRHPVLTVSVLAGVVLTATAGIAWRALSAQQATGNVERALADAAMDLKEGRYRIGLENANRALALAPDSVPARELRARLYLARQHAGKAAEDARYLLDRYPDNVTAHVVLAIASRWDMLSDHRPTIDGEQHLAFVEEHAGESADAHFLRGIFADSAAEKLRLFSQALEIDPGYPTAIDARLDVYNRQLMDLPRALADCERLIAVRPRSSQYRKYTANTYMKMRDYERALEEVERALEFDPVGASHFKMETRWRRTLNRP
jgi:tetratricopeptide (TPR) repeat protein